MTEAGTKWLVDYIKEHHPIPEYGNMVGAMEYGIRAFCEEVERRAAHPLDRRGVFSRGTLNAYNELKRELLGE